MTYLKSDGWRECIFSDNLFFSIADIVVKLLKLGCSLWLFVLTLPLLGSWQSDSRFNKLVKFLPI